MIAPGKPVVAAWTYPNELSFLVAETAREVSRLAASAGGQKAPAGIEAVPVPSRPGRFAVRASGGPPKGRASEIDVSQWMFAALAFSGFAKERLAGARGSQASGSATDRFLEASRTSDRGVGADGQGERQRRGGGEAWRPPPQPDREADVLRPHLR